MVVNYTKKNNRKAGPSSQYAQRRQAAGYGKIGNSAKARTAIINATTQQGQNAAVNAANAVAVANQNPTQTNVKNAEKAANNSALANAGTPAGPAAAAVANAVNATAFNYMGPANNIYKTNKLGASNKAAGLRTSQANAQQRLAAIEKRITIANQTKYKGNNPTNRQKYSKEGRQILAELNKIREAIVAGTVFTNANVSRVISQLNGIVKEIGKLRKEFAGDLRHRLFDTIVKNTGKVQTYVYNSSGLPNLTGQNIVYANAVKATTNTLMNYTAIINSANFNSNMKNNVGTVIFPAIMDMDALLLSYNSAAARIEKSQSINLQTLTNELARLNGQISANNANTLNRQKTNLLGKLNKIQQAITGGVARQ